MSLVETSVDSPVPEATAMAAGIVNPGFDINKAIKVYIAIRDKRAELKHEYTDQDTVLKSKQEKIESALLKFCNDTGMNSANTDHGTFYRQETVRANGDDWEKFYDWVKREDAFEALERRIKTSFVKEYMEKNEGRLPPGVSVYREYEVRVRRS